jgi:hypothetical protein
VSGSITSLGERSSPRTQSFWNFHRFHESCEIGRKTSPPRGGKKTPSRGGGPPLRGGGVTLPLGKSKNHQKGPTKRLTFYGRIFLPPPGGVKFRPPPPGGGRGSDIPVYISVKELHFFTAMVQFKNALPFHVEYPHENARVLVPERGLFF